MLPEVLSASTGIPKSVLISDAISALDAGLDAPWRVATSYFNSLPTSIQPNMEFVATDCGDIKANRIKIYFRTRTTKYSNIIDFLRIGGAYKGPVIEKAVKVC